MENYREENERAETRKKSSLTKTVAVLGTFDTKGDAFTYLIQKIREAGVAVLSIDAGTGEHGYRTDISNREIARLGGKDIHTLGDHRREALETMAAGGAKALQRLYENGEIHGFISMGGSGGTVLAAAAMKVLPVGFPKVLVSTVASSPRIFDYVDTSDAFLINSIVDISGLNSIVRKIYDQAAGAIAGAVKAVEVPTESHQGLRIAATMYGVTTPGVTAAMKYLTEKGYEVIPFHATGSGGRVMERLIRQGYFDGVLDMTQTEIGSMFSGNRPLPQALTVAPVQRKWVYPAFPAWGPWICAASARCPPRGSGCIITTEKAPPISGPMPPRPWLPADSLRSN